MGAIVTTAKSLNSGQSSVAGAGMKWRFAVSGTWAADETFIMALVNSVAGTTVQAGAGTVTGLAPTLALTFDKKVNLLAQDGWYFSDFSGGPTVWNDANRNGNGFIPLKDYYGTPENYVGLANFEGGLALLARNTVQIWNTDPAVENYNRRQVLKGVGTCAAKSVQAVGDSDVRFLADSGPRSLRVRAATTNAFPFDFGSPVQKLVRAVLRGLTDTQKAAACSITDPDTNNYWLFIPNATAANARIWVFSEAPESGVAAWSQYVATAIERTTVMPEASPPPGYNEWTVEDGETYYWTKNQFESTLHCGTVVLTASGYFVADGTLVQVGLTGLGQGTIELVTQTQFTPEKFILKDSRVYVRAGDEVYLYGGADNATYDRCGMQADTPFLNGKTPATRKTYSGADVACEGTWSVWIGCKPSAPDTVKLVYSNVDSSFERGRSLAALQGTHFKLRFVESGDGYALLSSGILHFDGGDNK